MRGDAVKKQLPAVIISADTTHRKVHPDDTRTGLILMDVDGKDHPDMLMDEMTASVQEMCDKYSYVIGYCLSPKLEGSEGAVWHRPKRGHTPALIYGT